MVDSSTAGFLQALAIGLVVGIILLLVFCILRTRVPDVFQHRRLLNTWKEFDNFNGERVGLTHPQPDDSFFGWIRPIFATDENEMLNKVGLDAVMFIRFIRTCFIICLFLALFGSIILMPTYGTANRNPPAQAEESSKLGPTEGLRIISLSNVPDKDGRLWATVVGEFFVAALVIYFMTKDFDHYSRLRRKYLTSENPVNYAVVVFDIPEPDRNDAAIRERFERLVPNQISDIIVLRQASTACSLEKKLDTAVVKRELAENIRSVKGQAPEMRPGMCGCIMCHVPKVDALHYWTEEQDRLANEIHDQGTLAKVTPSAIVLLTTKRAASYLVQANSSTSATTWKIERAPEPKAMHWSSFSMPGYQAEFRTILVAFFMVVFTIFWTIPAAAIVALFNLQNIPFAEKLTGWSSALTGLLEGLLPPVIMAVLISLIPMIFRMVIGTERIPSTGTIEMKTRDYFFGFTLYGSFLVIVLGSSFFQDYEQVTDNPGLIIDKLAQEVPGAGVYFATFILIKTLIPFPLLLSNVIRVVIRWIMLKLAKTERQKRRARAGGALFQYFRFSGGSMLILFLALTYSTLSPLVTVCAVAHFGMAYIVFRYSLLFTTYCPSDSGGQLFPGEYWGTMLGLILKQVITIAVLGLKKAPAQAAVVVVPTVLTMCFTFIVSRRYQRISEHGSLLDFSSESSKLDEIPMRYNMVYRQPAGKVTEFANLNGIAPVRDLYDEAEVPSGEGDTIHSETVDDSVGYVPDAAAVRQDV